jgi:hypothetical protein
MAAISSEGDGVIYAIAVVGSYTAIVICLTGVGAWFGLIDSK